MGCRSPNSSPNAVGYWGRNISDRIDMEQIPDKVSQLLSDKLESRGKRSYLWRQVTEDTANTLICSCIKNTTERPDITCNSCYGTGVIPGYKLFLHETLYLSSISPNSSLINVHVDTEIKPHRILLNDFQLNGLITSSRIQFSNPLGLDWDIRVDSPNIKSTNLVTVSFSTNGVNFYPIEDINGVNKPVGVGGLYIQVSLSRESVEDRSPEFQMVRLRHPNRTDPYIKILRPNVNEIPTLMQYGGRIENVGERFWTMPLSYFDSTIPENTVLARIVDNAFYARVDGINAGIRFVTTKLMFNEEFGIFTHQSFEPRRVQPEEVYGALVF